MKFVLSILLLIPSILFSQVNKSVIQAPEVQIKTAVLAAPEEQRDSTRVYGYNEKRELVVLREGTNNLVCIADNPNQEGIQVACYNLKLEPFMARGRELVAEGRSEEEKRSIREKEAEAGTLQMPDVPSMLYILSGSEENYDQATGELKDGNFRYVIYTPFATTESTGLPAKPGVPGMPWLMDPGTHRAHIMITPPKQNVNTIP